MNNTSQKELPRYLCHKVVHALKIESVDLYKCLITPVDKTYAPFYLDVPYMNKHNPQAGGYYVVYEDGYKSWSPAEAFESGYTLIEEGN